MDGSLSSFDVNVRILDITGDSPGCQEPLTKMRPDLKSASNISALIMMITITITIMKIMPVLITITIVIIIMIMITITIIITIIITMMMYRIYEIIAVIDGS